MRYLPCTLFLRKDGATDALGNTVQVMEQIGTASARRLSCTAQDISMLGRSASGEICKLHLCAAEKDLHRARVVLYEGAYYEIRNITGVRRMILFAEKRRT